MHRSLARWLVVGALAVFGLGLLANVAFAQAGAQVQGQNSADDGTAGTGTATGSNANGFAAGPSAAAGGTANSQQLGSNSATVDQSGSGKSGDPVAGGQVTGAVGNAKVQNQNSASGNTAISGDVLVTNDAAAALGPNATSATSTAQASQVGHNDLTVRQAVTSSTGDAVAGSQITGIADANEALVQNQNSAADNVAFSGFSAADNILTATAGPAALTSGPLAQASQVGDNDAVIEQSSQAASGDSVAGSQVTGVVGGSDFTVQNQNRSEGNVGITGDAFAFSFGAAILGPSATSVDPLGISAEAQAGQTGDNQLVADQTSGSSSGDALAGAQVTGLVSEDEGHLEVNNQQSSDTDTAISGDSDSAVLLSANAGPVAFAGSALAGTAAGAKIVVIGGNAEAQASQVGDNSTDATQTSGAISGDGVAGGQVTGTVGGSEINIQEQNSADNAFALSGDTTSDATAIVQSGPSAVADAGALFTAIGPLAAAFPVCPNAGPNCTATATAALDVTLIGGTADAQASQTGDNSAALDQTVSATSGDAVAGGQVTGTVTDSATVTIQNQNASDSSTSTTGDSDATATAVVSAGPLGTALADATLVVLGPLAIAGANCAAARCTASATATATLTATLIGGDATAQASQVGDNATAVAQSVSADTGDAVAGAQVTGVVAGDGSDITIQNQNSSDTDTAVTGDADTTVDTVVASGPVSDARADAGLVVIGGLAAASAACVGDGCVAISTATARATVTSVGGTSDSQASQTGDNEAAVDQSVAASSGDAVAGAQVTGSVAGDGSDVTIQNQNAADDAFGTTGDAVADATTVVVSGPQAFSDASSGALALATIAIANASCVGAGCADLPFARVIVGVDSIGGDAEAQASQNGDNRTAASQAIAADTGDAVAGAQVTGSVAGDGSDVTIQNQNTGDLATAVTGDASTTNDATVVSGPAADADASAGALVVVDIASASGFCLGAGCADLPLATAAVGGAADGGNATAQASQQGDNDTSLDQAVSASTGDAVGGSQVTGSVAGDGSSTTINEQNSADGAIAASGDADTTNLVDVNAGPAADADATAFLSAVVTIANASGICVGDGCVTLPLAIGSVTLDATGGHAEAQASQTGDNATAVDQSVSAGTGDAVGGAQVTGAVSGDDSAITIQSQNSADDPIATTGDADAVNVAGIFSGPNADADASVSVVSLGNIADAGAGCFGVGCHPASVGFATVDVTATGGDAEAQASQIGDNHAAFDQAASVATGDAVSGAQVTGAVAGDGSETTISGQNTADAPFAVSGDASALNFADVNAGPDAVTNSGVEVTTEDSGADASATCVGNGCTAISAATTRFAVDAAGGTSTSQASQTGDNAARIDQTLVAGSGDAVAGSQVTGSVSGNGSTTTVQNQNSSDDAAALSGLVFGANVAGAEVGPDADAGASVLVNAEAVVVSAATCFGTGCVAIASGSITVDATLAGGDAEAQASQTGDNAAHVSQTADGASGDALAGSQVTGVVTEDGDVTVSEQNSSDASFTFSGDVTLSNGADITAGPTANTDADADALIATSARVVATCGPPGCTAFSTPPTVTITVAAAPGTTEAQASQIGDNNVSASQDANATSGDAVSGSQVTGVVGATNSDVLVQNHDDGGSFAFSGVTVAVNTIAGAVGPSAFSPLGDAAASHTGDSEAAADQAFTSVTGDALTGSQVSGVVA